MSRRSMALSTLAAGSGLRVTGDADATVSGIVYDSREVRPGDLFAALPGAYFDGHDYAGTAVAAGAAALLVERPIDVDVPQLIADDSRAALAGVAARFYGHPSAEIEVVGITGTDGKTTTAFLADAILRHAGLTTGMIGTVAVRIGDEVDLHATRQTTPESSEIQRYLRSMVEAGAAWAVLEATSHGLDLHRLDHVRFRIGAVTNVTHEHLEHHKTVEAYRKAKAILFERVAAERGAAVVNLDDPGAAAMIAVSKGAAVLSYSAAGHPAADLRAAAIELGSTGSRFTLEFQNERAVVSLPLVGSFNVENALCATGVALAAGLGLEVAAAALDRAPQVPGRLERVEAGQPFSVIVDYAHTPAALEAILRVVRGLHPSGRVIAVFGSAGERDVAKRAMQGAVSARLADLTIATSEDPRGEDPESIVAQVAAGAREAGAVVGESLHSVVDRRQAVRLALSVAEPGDCVLLAGKGHEQSMIWGREKRPWDEATVAAEELAELGYSKPSPPV